MQKKFINLALIYKAFCDDNRLQVINQLAQGEHCACDLLSLLNISQSTLSHHMHILTESKIVTARKSGKWTYYSLDESGCTKAKAELNDLLTKRYVRLMSCDCEEKNNEAGRD